MRRITWIFALGLAALALAAAGCGGDDDGQQRHEQPRPTPPRLHGGSTEAAGGGGAETLTVTADPDGGISWDKTSLSAKAGKVTLKLVSASSTPHAIEVEGNGVEEETKTITGGETEVTVDLKAGEYEYYCPVDDHRQTMKGT